MSSTDINVVFNRQKVIAVGIISAAAVAFATYIYQKQRKPKIPSEWKPVGKVASLCIYPLKSARRNEVQEAECTKRGLMEVEKPDKSFRLCDRAFLLYLEQNLEFRTGRQYPKLMLIKVEAHDADTVAINAPGMRTLFLRIPSKKKQEVVTIKYFKQENIKAIDCGDEAAAWVSQYILDKDHGLRLGFNDGSFTRDQINELYKDEINFYKRGLRNESSGLNADLVAMLIINKASVLDLNKRMGHSEVTTDNFRPTLVVDGPDLSPYEEDNWEWIKVGNVVMKNVVPCFRCIMTTIDPETGVRRNDREPLKTLEKYRITEGPSKSPVMGICLEVFETGVISVGDIVYVGKA